MEHLNQNQRTGGGTLYYLMVKPTGGISVRETNCRTFGMHSQRGGGEARHGSRASGSEADMKLEGGRECGSPLSVG